MFKDVRDGRLVKILERPAGQQFAPFQRPVHHQYPSAPEIKDLRTVHASGNERIFRLRSRS